MTNSEGKKAATDPYREAPPELGPLEGEHGPAFSGSRKLWWIVRAAFFSAWTLYLVASLTISFGVIVIGAVALIHIVIVVDFHRNADIAVEVYRDGFRVHRRGRWQSVKWDDITTYTTYVERVGPSIVWFNWWSNVARTRVVVTTRTGTIELTSALDGLLKVGARIRSESLKRLRRKAKADLEAGVRVDFGRLVLDPDGIERDGDRLQWADVASIEVTSGQIIVRRGPKKKVWSRDPYLGTPNAHVLVDMIERRLKVAAPLTSP